ncbi:sulfurtransferase complex subunit TusD [Porticoccus sp. W117]|uniref:sulfurtransferase complex subunit TusD n=1 Tax=Porticoccus sp. W117 TaxID=3054777 RepID=UPI002594F46A|nr:sulfurtransferase complex subunit TusD [Porticoccus sp. W117]MDM3871698.1 sulfurtransferase complex subunit TusD [Porticoccus sp. W117]
MKFSLIVLGAPGSHQAASSALRFANAALESGHQIYRVFFYNDGVHNGSQLLTPPQGEDNIREAWKSLGEKHGTRMTVCIASALRRGIVDSEEAERYDYNSGNLDEPNFKLQGLGELADAALQSDRLITFGR